MLSKFIFNEGLKREQWGKEIAERVCVVESESSHNMSKIVFAHSKILYIKKAAVSVMKGLNVQSECPSRIYGGDL